MGSSTSQPQSTLAQTRVALTTMLNSILPPDQRAKLLRKLKTFGTNNPKLAAFLAPHIVLTGIPIVLFVLFAISVFLFALVTALLTAVLGTVLFTAFTVGVALLVLLPTVFFTTLAATAVFLWGLGGYLVLQKAGFLKERTERQRGDAGDDREGSVEALLASDGHATGGGDQVRGMDGHYENGDSQTIEDIVRTDGAPGQLGPSMLGSRNRNGRRAPTYDHKEADKVTENIPPDTTQLKPTKQFDENATWAQDFKSITNPPAAIATA